MWAARAASTNMNWKGGGLRVLAYNKAIAPVATFMVTYLVGSADEGAGLTGATHFLEHLMFKGTARFNSRQGTGVFSVLQRVGSPDQCHDIEGPHKLLLHAARGAPVAGHRH